ncbi:hypothetical protein ASE01_23025 [Nocardioides sp. Root190]|uniref:hypothetical protein n=1 Tax=Nocardioides sp. Root190 TaxID=1736488 RepID=UPI0006F6615A|nr:hypothetical protein [Nocardioides sp. Root190]KRB79607.1 hypothetical protein ASE01_23025 [Nocardioides sp. Root190]
MGPLTRPLPRPLLGCFAAFLAATVLPVSSVAARTDEDPGPALAGTPVVGASDPEEAPPLRTGRYLDRLPADGPLHYRLPRTEDGTTFHVAALFVGAGDSVGEGLRLEIGTTPGSQGCGSSGVFRPTPGEPAPLLFTAVSTWTDVTDHECAVAEDLHLALGVPGDRADVGREVELLVFEEPPLSQYSFDLLPEPDLPTWTPVEPATPARRIPAGTTPTNAPVVGDGTYTVTLRPGRTAVLAVPLNWDQSLQAQLDTRLPDGAPHPDGIAVEIVGPMLGTSQVAFGARAPDDWTVRPRAGARLRTGAQSHVVSYPNRDSYDATINTESLAGIHYVLVRWGGTNEIEGGTAAEDLAVRARLTLATTGAAAQGIPDYTPIESMIGPQAGSRLVDGTLQAAPEVGPEDRPDDRDDDSGFDRRDVAAVVGVAVVCLIGFAVARRRRARQGPTRRAGRARGR